MKAIQLLWTAVSNWRGNSTVHLHSLTMRYCRSEEGSVLSSLSPSLPPSLPPPLSLPSLFPSLSPSLSLSHSIPLYFSPSLSLSFPPSLPPSLPPLLYTPLLLQLVSLSGSSLPLPHQQALPCRKLKKLLSATHQQMQLYICIFVDRYLHCLFKLRWCVGGECVTL